MNPNELWWIKNLLALALLKQLLEKTNTPQRFSTESVIDVYEDNEKIALTALMTKVESEKDIGIDVTESRILIEYKNVKYPFNIREGLKIDPSTTKAIFRPETGVLDISIRKVIK